MLIQGFQKMTLLDYPGQVACTVFTGGCNLRCPFCHNASLVLPGRGKQVENEERVLQFLERRRGMLDGVAVTGGEPLLHAGLPAFLQKVRALGYRIKLDTNGTFPERLREVVEAGLIDYVAMDVKNAFPCYAESVGLPAFDASPVRRSMEYLLSLRAEQVTCEFRTTVVRGLHTAERLMDTARALAGAQAYYLQAYRDSGDVIAPEGLGSFSDAEMRDLLKAVRTVFPAAELRGVD